jgi:hypothetical protein
MPKYWFKPKSHGYGASPNTWEGWVATAVATAAPGVLGWALLVPRTDAAAKGIGTGPFLIWVAATIAILVGFMRLARSRTDGEWKWRWKRPAALDDNGQSTLGQESTGKR